MEMSSAACRLFDRDVKGLVKFFSRLQRGAYSPDVSYSLYSDTLIPSLTFGFHEPITERATT